MTQTSRTPGSTSGALQKAQRDIDLEPERYKHYWLREMPEDLAEVVDVRRFGPGERIVFEPYTREMFEQTQRWMKSWDLLDLDVETRHRVREGGARVGALKGQLGRDQAGRTRS